MKHSEKVFIIIGLLFLALLMGYVKWRKDTIDKDAVFVLAKVTKISTGGENGPLLYFHYKFKKTEYQNKFSGFFHIQDSLILIKISESQPYLYTYTDIEIPYCFIDEKLMDSSWKKIPFCHNLP